MHGVYSSDGGYAMDGIFMAAYAIKALIDKGEDYSDNKTLMQEIRKTTFIGVAGKF